MPAELVLKVEKITPHKPCGRSTGYIVRSWATHLESDAKAAKHRHGFAISEELERPYSSNHQPEYEWCDLTCSCNIKDKKERMSRYQRFTPSIFAEDSSRRSWEA